MVAPVLLERSQAAHHAQQLRTAYQQAQKAQWDLAARLELQRVTLSGLRVYLSLAPEDPESLVYHTMLVDLLSHAPQSQLIDLDDTERRAARVAATRVLQNPKTPEHRPKSQNLLKRLDLIQNPLLQARERLLVWLTKRLRDEPENQKIWGATHAARFIIFRRAARVLGLSGVPEEGDPRGKPFALALESLGPLLDSDALEAPDVQSEIFVNLQVIGGAVSQEPVLKASEGAFACLADEALSPVPVLRHALLHMLFQIDVPALGPAERPAVAQWFNRLPAILKRLVDLDPDEQDATLMRLRHHLTAPTSLGLEQRIETALLTFGRINARRDAVTARLARLEQQVDPLVPLEASSKAEFASLRERLRRLARLRDVLLGANLVSNAPQVNDLLARVYARIEDMAALPEQTSEAFHALVADIQRQLDAPEAAARTWFPPASDLLRRLSETLRSHPHVPGTTWAGDKAARARATLEKARITLQLLTQSGRIRVDDSQMANWISECIEGFDRYQETGNDDLLAEAVARMMRATAADVARA
ncbi:MAG: hypothetical protein VKN33_10935 [Candidatus Sericytochromatia bacterium]|nr:hypothetical protein [Candidatus Sericytochromatia bacterium]